MLVMKVKGRLKKEREGQEKTERVTKGRQGWKGKTRYGEGKDNVEHERKGRRRERRKGRTKRVTRGREYKTKGSGVLDARNGGK